MFIILIINYKPGSTVCFNMLTKILHQLVAIAILILRLYYKSYPYMLNPVPDKYIFRSGVCLSSF